MAQEGSDKMLWGVIAVLAVALVLVIVLWQQDRQTKELELDVDTSDARVLVEPFPVKGVLS